MAGRNLSSMMILSLALAALLVPQNAAADDGISARRPRRVRPTVRPLPCASRSEKLCSAPLTGHMAHGLALLCLQDVCAGAR